MRTAFVFVLFFFRFVSNAQPGTYLADLEAVKSILQNMPSYKAQIKGDRLAEYNTLYNRLAFDTISNPISYQYFYNLAQLFFPLRDNHLGFYQLQNYNNFKTKETIDSFMMTEEFLAYPTLKINIDSLKTDLVKKPVHSIEGIYHYGKFYTVGLFKNGEHEFIGVVLDSDTSLWPRGQIAIHLYEFAPDLYKAIYGHPLYKYFLLQPIEKYQNQSLVNSYFYGSYYQSVYSKQLGHVDHINLPKSSSKFALKNINDDVQYVVIQTFQRSAAIAQASQRFYDSIKSLRKTSNLILDLRNNEGGAEKEMTKYLKLVKEYLRNGHLYVLINNGTLSQAEIFVLELKQLKNVTTLGQTTKGVLSYGSNYGRRERLPSGRFEIYPTDMKGDAKRLPYEDYGIKPDIFLHDDGDWIEQVVEIIRKK